MEGGGPRRDFFGINWHLNPATRVMWNYTRADLDSVGEPAHLFTMRFQIAF